jgi:hypothetical protein
MRDGKKFRQRFSVAAFGDDKALAMAVDLRKSKEAEIGSGREISK